MAMKTLTLDLSENEKLLLRKNRVKMNSLSEFAADEIAELIKASPQRAKEIHALIVFQSIPSVGPKFARDLISMGYYSIDDFLDTDGAVLFEELERRQGFWTDPCVEDQFRLVVHYAHNRGSNKNWWDFTAERKTYRAQNGYPSDRPKTAWHELRPAAVS
jgi:hypothetical protein